MLRFTSVESGKRLVNEDLEMGDSYYLVGYHPKTGKPNFILRYEVTKCLKTEFVCTREPKFVSNQPVELRLKRNKTTPNCYSGDDPALEEFRSVILLQKKRREADKIITEFPIAKFGDEKLLAAIEEYWDRQQKKAE